MKNDYETPILEIVELNKVDALYEGSQFVNVNDFGDTPFDI